MKIIIEKINGLFNLKAIYDYLVGMSNGKYQFTIKKVRKPRTLDQNAWLWGCIYPMMLDGLIDAGWEFTDIEQVHEFFKSQFTVDKVINKYTGEIIEFPSSTSKMDTVVFTTYCEKLREYSNEYLNIDIPDPNKEWRNAYKINTNQLKS